MASCIVPVTIRLIGRPGDPELARLQHAVAHAVAGRLLAAQRALGPGGVRAGADFGRRPAAKKKRAVAPRARARPDPDPRDVREFAALSGKGAIHLADRHGNPIRTLRAYLRQRRATFRDDPSHPDDAYRAFAEQSDAELNANSELRRVLEYGDDEEAQTAFYRWVRKAYIQHHVTEGIPGYIMRAYWRFDRLRRLVERQGVAAYGPRTWKRMKLSIGGFDPRPVKTAEYRYQLGTLSEHAKGAAVDIDPDHNAVLSLEQWRWIEGVTGAAVRDPKRWRELWRTDPRQLWQTIKDVNDAFVKEIAAAIREEEARQERMRLRADMHLVEGRLTEPPGWAAGHLQLRWEEEDVPESRRLMRAAPVEVVFASQPKLKRFRFGFFALEWPLVERLHAQNLVWGAIFSTKVDLHHFELAPGVVEEEEARSRAWAERHHLGLPTLVAPVAPPGLRRPPISPLPFPKLRQSESDVLGPSLLERSLKPPSPDVLPRERTR